MDEIEYLYMAEEDLFRLGNSTSPRVDHVRNDDVDMFELNDSRFVVANGKGISLLTESRLPSLKGGWLWKVPASLPLPQGLALNDDRPDHYSLCPTTDMTIDA
jgi:hypothetical protein